MGPEARGDGVEVGVVVPRVADELPCAVWDVLEQAAKGAAVEVASGGDADGAARSENPVRGDRRRGFKAAVAGLECANEQAAPRASAQRGGPAWLERVADATNAGLFEGTDDRTRDAREQVGVFVGINVCEFQAGVLKLLDLCECLALDVVLRDGAAEDAEREICERGAEGTAVGAEQCWDACWVRDWCAVDEDDMAADSERRAVERDRDGVIEGCTVGHEGCGGDGARFVQFGDGAIDAARETEVIRINDESNRH